MIAKLFIATVCVAVAGCATAINFKTAERYYEAGLQAEAAKNWPGAREAFRRSLINAQSAGAPQVFMSAVTYNLGRMSGYTCDYAQAEKLLLESLALEQGLQKPDPANITKRWSELGRLYQDQQRFNESATFYARAVPELERLGVVESDPIGFAQYLADYSQSLLQSGQAASAASAAARASELRTKYAARSAQFTPIRYRDVCSMAP
jgi:tetratricopeptide (TPR) repeat protein